MKNDTAFNTLIEKLANFETLIYPNFNEQFILQTDASNVGLGAVLLKMYNGIKRPIAYASRKLKIAKTKYSTIEKEHV